MLYRSRFTSVESSLCFVLVTTDLSKLLPAGLLSDEVVAEAIKNYHSANGKIATDGNSKVRREDM